MQIEIFKIGYLKLRKWYFWDAQTTFVLSKVINSALYFTPWHTHCTLHIGSWLMDCSHWAISIRTQFQTNQFLSLSLSFVPPLFRVATLYYYIYNLLELKHPKYASYPVSVAHTICKLNALLIFTYMRYAQCSLSSVHRDCTYSFCFVCVVVNNIVVCWVFICRYAFF